MSFSNDAIKFLVRHGYLDTPKADDPIDESISKITGDLTSLFTNQDDLIRNGLMLLQGFYGLSPTGQLDEDTLSTIKTPRCTIKDKLTLGEGGDHSDFRLAARWDKKELTWRVLKYPSNDLGEERVRSTLKSAFSLWARYADLQFREDLTTDYPDMRILWESGDHNDGDAFDNAGGTLAHAFFPQQGEMSGDIHFDDDERWTLGSYSGINLRQVAVHEIGHSLGLEHSNVRGAIMFPSYEGYRPNLDLAEDDIQGIRQLYGPAQGGGVDGREEELEPEEEWVPGGVGGAPTLFSILAACMRSCAIL